MFKNLGLLYSSSQEPTQISHGSWEGNLAILLPDCGSRLTRLRLLQVGTREGTVAVLGEWERLCCRELATVRLTATSVLAINRTSLARQLQLTENLQLQLGSGRRLEN